MSLLNEVLTLVLPFVDPDKLVESLRCIEYGKPTLSFGAGDLK